MPLLTQAVLFGGAYGSSADAATYARSAASAQTCYVGGPGLLGEPRKGANEFYEVSKLRTGWQRGRCSIPAGRSRQAGES